MNRIIVIGNGFDKAHGLATGYKDLLMLIGMNLPDISLADTPVGKQQPMENLVHYLIIKMNLLNLKS